MKIKNDPESVAKLSRISTADQLTGALKVMELIKRISLSNGEEIDHNIATIREAIKIKTEAAIYAFHKFDGLGVEMGEIIDSQAHGISLFKRYGDRLQHILGAETPAETKKTIEFLQKQGIKKVITGSIIGEFCGVTACFDTDDYSGRGYEITYDALHEDEYNKLVKAGIEVHVLDKLV